jgi:hypothetical protein
MIPTWAPSRWAIMPVTNDPCVYDGNIICTEGKGYLWIFRTGYRHHLVTIANFLGRFPGNPGRTAAKRFPSSKTEVN